MSQSSGDLFSTPTGARRWGVALVAVVALAMGLAACGEDDEEAPALQKASSIDEFDPDAAAGSTPDLPARVAWANSSDAEFLINIGKGMEASAESRDLEFATAIANDQPERQVANLESFLQRGAGGLALQQINPDGEEAPLQQAIDQGVAVFTQFQVPATSTVTADQCEVGRTQGEAAGEYISENMNGEANVVYFNSDSIELLKPRSQCAIEGLKELAPNAKIVANQEPEGFTPEAAAKAMGTILQSEPNVDVVIGGDVFVLGALREIEAQGKEGQIEYMSGVDGQSESFDLVRSGDSPYKAVFAFPMQAIGWAWGQFAADWLEGKSIPQVIELGTVTLDSPESVEKFEGDMSVENLPETWDRPDIMTLRGNINYDTRDGYLREIVTK
jgi:ribose transport system substrate-binding protein